MTDAMAVQKYDVCRPASAGGAFEERYWSLVNSPVFGPDGAIAYIIHRVEDATEFVGLKHQEDGRTNVRTAIRAEQMEAEVLHRAQELQEVNRRLRQANEELTALYQKTQEHDRRKYEFLALLGHEFCATAGTAAHAIEVIQEFGPVDPNLQWATDLIDRQVRFMTRMVDDLLDVARITSGKITAPARAGGTRSGGGAGGRSHPSAHRHPAAPTARFPSLRSAARGSRPHPSATSRDESVEQRRQVHGQRRANLAVGGAEGKEVVLRVQDTGTGISVEMLPEIFDLFTQADRSLDGAQGGLGIGLTLVRKSIEMHGGSIQAFRGGIRARERVHRSLYRCWPKRSDRGRFDRRQGVRSLRPSLAVFCLPTTTKILSKCWPACCGRRAGMT